MAMADNAMFLVNMKPSVEGRVISLINSRVPKRRDTALNMWRIILVFTASGGRRYINVACSKAYIPQSYIL
ncbi:hypothetical protein Pogu_2736 [Pyrobaculum oguniense TE7]|uniref:Uncharacterized protein n=1 Tax=Pyrobaculum oguniense (strain DSM 13380 / JCM 10595 / TE7) TaxID=698757 RepID=H6QDZ1_PYROT|nr:hypothetical protein Pogu_2736 [Pyrobaculum oguniense TE7]